MRRVLAALVALSLVTAGAVAQVDAGSPGDVPAVVDLADAPAPAIEDPVSASELEDMKTIAAQKGMSLQTAIERYAWNDNFALAVASIRKAAPEAFTAARIVDGKHAWVAFAGEAPAIAFETIRAFQKAHGVVGVAVDEGVGFTEAEIDAGVPAVHYAVRNAPGVKDATTSFDFESRKIKVIMVLGASPGDRAIPDLRASATAGLVEAGLGGLLDRITVEIVGSDHPVLAGVDANGEHVGGEALNDGDCTSGFSVVNGAGVTGVSTAGHCANAQTDDNAALVFKAGHEGQQGDFQWHTGGQLEPDDFYSGAVDVSEVKRRDVAATGAPVVGATLCKNGAVGFKDCGEVIQLNVCHFEVCNLVQMDARRATGGDSGGPVFLGNTAYGLHRGWRYDPVFPFDRDLFSRADRIDNALGVSIRD
jgi:hypothetical protein